MQSSLFWDLEADMIKSLENPKLPIPPSSKPVKNETA